MEKEAAPIQEMIQLFNQLENENAPPLPQLSDEEISHLYNTAYQLYKNGKYSDAKQFFHFLNLINPFDRRFWLGSAACFHMLKEYKPAIEHYSIAAIQDPLDPYAHWHAAECFLATGQIDKGLIALQSAIEAATQKSEHQSFLEQLLVVQRAWTQTPEIPFQEALNG